MMPTRFLQEVAPELVVDVGANRGQFLIDVRDALPAAKVIAFEPLPDEFAVLESIHGMTHQTDLRMIAVGDRTGEATMHVSAAADSSSTLPITSAQDRLYPGTREVGVETVPISTLDEQLNAGEIPSRSVLKIDVQGGELAVLRGAETVLRRFGYVLVEVSFLELYADQPLAADVVTFLSSNGFLLDRALSLSIVDGAPVQSDFVFRNERLHDE